MATNTIQTCDVCGMNASTTATLAVDGATTEVDLCAKHTKELTAALKPYTSVGRTTGRSRAAVKKSQQRGTAEAPTAKKSATKRGAKKTTAKKASPVKQAAPKKSAVKRSRRGKSQATEIRAWANANGVPVGLKGTVRKEVVDAFNAAQK